MKAKQFEKFCKLSVVTDYKHVYSKIQPTQRQLQYADKKGIQVVFMTRENKWFELDFYAK